MYALSKFNGQHHVAGEAEINDADGERFKVQVYVHLRPIKREVKRALNQRVGWIWDDVVSETEKITRRAAHIRLDRQIKTIVSDPRFGEGMDLASTIFPPLGVAYGTVVAATKAVNAAKSGDARARAHIDDIVAAAANGDPHAEAVRQAMVSITDAQADAAKIKADVEAAKSVQIILALPHEAPPLPAKRPRQDENEEKANR